MALDFDPQRLPVLRSDGDLPSVPADRLLAAALRRRFADPPSWQPEIEAERRLLDRPSTAASVLVALVLRDPITVILTQRTDHLTDHAGQISFPGGRAEAVDADAVATALREAHEEIGLEPARVDVLGTLPPYVTGTGYVVTPVVGTIAPGFTVRADPFEVADVFEVPLDFLMNPANHRWHEVEIGGMRRAFLSMPWDGSSSGGAPKRYFVWGATAAMLRNLYRFLIA